MSLSVCGQALVALGRKKVRGSNENLSYIILLNGKLKDTKEMHKEEFQAHEEQMD